MRGRREGDRGRGLRGTHLSVAEGDSSPGMGALGTTGDGDYVGRTSSVTFGDTFPRGEGFGVTGLRGKRGERFKRF